ncbi:metal-dependent hydrolase [Sphaerotilus mobilis]|nr:metal-dependent hydrolase [Sphaerotilus mobilis]
MDTLTHAISGALLARLLHARTPTSGAQVTASNASPPLWTQVLTGTVAAAFPDIDSFTQFGGDVLYLTQHRGYTHALALVPLWGWLVAWLIAVGLRGRASWRSLYLSACGGIALHIAGDWITPFGTLLGLPFTDTRYGLGVMFIIDLSFTGLLLAGCALAAIWPTRRWPAALGLLATCGWVVLAWVGQQEALAIGQQRAAALGWRDAQVVAMPRPASPFNWTVAVSDGSRYELADLNTRRREPLQAGPDAHFITRFSAPYLPAGQATWRQASRWGDPGAANAAEVAAIARAAWEHPSFAFYRWFAEVPHLVDAGVRADGRCATFGDLRFGFPGREEAPFRYEICLREDGSASRYKRDGASRTPI